MGRFAPTPSGDLHLGSLYAATAAYLDARAHGGHWGLRIEDLDKPREVEGSADRILRTLELFGFEWDGPVVRQSERTPRYEEALRVLAGRGLTYHCSCSRQQLDEDGRYPGTCRDRAVADAMPATRLRIESDRITFADRIQGTFRQDVQAAVGDIILKRRDQLFAYVLAVVIDDAAQGVTHIVRGADLLDNTPRQIVLQRLLGLTTPAYAHVAVLTEPDGTKLAKSRRAVPLGEATPLPQLLTIFKWLGLAPPACLNDASLSEAFAWAIGQWRIGTVPKRLSLPLKY